VKNTHYRRIFWTKNRRDGEWMNIRRIGGYQTSRVSRVVLRYDSLRLMITIAEQYAFKLCHLNIKTAWYSILVQGR
jgi:hypothetical protein